MFVIKKKGETHMYNPVNKYITYKSKLITFSPKVNPVPLKSTVMFCLERHISFPVGNCSNIVNFSSLMSRTIFCKDKQGKSHKDGHRKGIDYNYEKIINSRRNVQMLRALLHVIAIT